MLVVISDLHFVDGTAGFHNLPSEAFTSVFLSDIIALARDKGAKELKLLLLGDLVDLIRTEHWLEVNVEDRPWGRNGLADVPRLGSDALPERRESATEARCLDILGRWPEDGKRASVPHDTILYQNWKTLEFFRTFGDRVRKALRKDDTFKVDVIYVPGNHDRFCNLYPSVRDAVQQFFGLSVDEAYTFTDEATGEWWYRYDYMDLEYGLFARHGHQYDYWNYGGRNDLSWRGQVQPCIGDVIATEFAVKLPYKLRLLTRERSDISEEAKAALIEKVKDIDLVRPLNRIFEWFYYKLSDVDQGPVREVLDEAFEAVVQEFLELEFVQRWRHPGTLIDDALRLLASRFLRWVPQMLFAKIEAEDLLPLFVSQLDDAGSLEADPYVRAAYSETVWKDNPRIHYVLYGHTHAPLSCALDGERGREVLYINTGTWRERIQRTIHLDRTPDFIKLKAITYANFYAADEDADGKEPGTVSFDMWTGSKKKHYRA